MFCKNCGTQIDDNATVCKNCGEPITSTLKKSSGEEAVRPVDGTSKGEGRVFVSPEEETIAVLGGGYFNNFLKTGSLSKGFCIVSQKRVYFKGRCFSIGNKSMSKLLEESVVDLKDITGTGLMQKNPIMLLIIAVIFLFAAAIFLFKSFDDSDNLLTTVIVGVIGFIFLFLYNFMKVKMFQILFAGGRISLDANNFSYSEIVDFQRRLRIAIDKRNEEIYRTIRETSFS